MVVMVSSAIKNRFYASLVHFACSILIACVVVGIVFFVWYPGSIAKAAGVTEVFFLVLIVDVCLGPLLTLVVFNTEKKELKRDLLIILLVQLSALFYGIYTVGVVRPIYVVFVVDRFELVYANELARDSLELASSEEYKSIPFWGPEWISARLPDDENERAEFMFRSLEGGADLAQSPQYYFSYAESRGEVIDKLQPLEKLEQFNVLAAAEYNKLINQYSPDLAKYGYLPLHGDFMDFSVVVDRQSADVIEIVELKPWK